MQLSNLKLISILAAGVVAATLAIGVSGAHGAREVGPGIIAAYAADEGTPLKLRVALKADEGVPQNLIAAHQADEGTPPNLIVALKADEGVPQNLVTA